MRTRWLWLFLAALPMFALIALRDSSLGADTAGYLKFFDKMVRIPWDRIFIVNNATYEFEEGFVVFEKLVTHITHDSLVYLVSVVTFANQLEKAHFTFLYFYATLGLYTFMFTGVRQSLAMCVCLFSYQFLKNKRFIPFLLMVVLAFYFHKSAILFLTVYFIYDRKIGWLNMLLYALLGLLAYNNIDIIQEWFNDTLEYDYGIEKTGNGVVFLLVIIAITVFAYCVILANRVLTDQARGMLNVGVITLIFWVLRLETRVAERPSYYFMFFTIAMLCHAIEAPKEEKERSILKVVICVLCMALYMYRFMSNFSNMIPYQTFF